MAKRLQAMGIEKYADGFAVRLHLVSLHIPKQWKQGTLIFVNSMSDLFHESIPLEYIQQVFRVMEECPQHQFQVLTKRAERLAELSPQLPWPPNVWMGVSVENREVLPRIDWLRQSGALIKFQSLEPLLEDLGAVDYSGIDWVIVGGESGRRPRPMHPSWVERIQQQYASQKVPFFFKQWGGTNKKAAGRELKGQTYDEIPLAVRSGS
jgi:protein gp37